VAIDPNSGVRLDAETDVVLLADGALWAALRGDGNDRRLSAGRRGGLLRVRMAADRRRCRQAKADEPQPFEDRAAGHSSP
jgi:hypothetical protein